MPALDLEVDIPRKLSEEGTPISLTARIATLCAITLPFLGLIAAFFFFWGAGFSWLDLGLLIVMYVATTLGITVGFHRLFVHRSFETTKTVRAILAILGSMAIQGDVLTWVGLHRRHHEHSDTEEDPHSPHHQGAGLSGWFKGYWHAHIGWFFDPIPSDLPKYLKDLYQDRLISKISKLFPLWVILSLLIPALIGGLVTLSWSDFLSGLIWGGLVRILLVHHVTWSVNSACHIWGAQTYTSDDMSRDNLLFGILALGEGWHNTHHTFPSSARHGLRWYQPDVSYLFIKVLEKFRLAWNIKVPTQVNQEKKRRRTDDE